MRRVIKHFGLGAGSIEHYAFHLSLADVVVDGHRAIGTEDVQLRPLSEGIIARFCDGMLGQQLLFPG
jgi:hypothetical protein